MQTQSRIRDTINRHRYRQHMYAVEAQVQELRAEIERASYYRTLADHERQAVASLERLMGRA